MYRLLLVITLSLSLWACKEVPVNINFSETIADDTTYIAGVEMAQDKKYLIEELSGVQCVNCPTGIAMLNEMNASGTYAGKLVIVSIHSGAFTDPIPDKSKQNLAVPSAAQMVAVILGGEKEKPCAAFDRLAIKPNESLLLPRYTSWPSFMANTKDSSSSKAPINIDITSGKGDAADEFDIEVKIAYTQEMTGNHSLNIYLTQDKIIDYSLTPTGLQEDYEFNHTFRDFVTPPTGKSILNEYETKEAGRVYIYKTKVKIDNTQENQKYWVPENMNVIAFVSSSSNGTKRVYQAAETQLMQ